MSDVLAPVFEDRNTRLSSFSDEQRGQLELTAKNSGDPEFLDRQFSAMWLSRRTGLPHDEVVKNFDGLSRLYFGEGATPSKAYDSISGLYKKAGTSSVGSGEIGGESSAVQPASPYSVSGTVISKDIAGSLAQDASRTGYSTLGGIYSNLASATGVKLKRPRDSAEYNDLMIERGMLTLEADTLGISASAYGIKKGSDEYKALFAGVDTTAADARLAEIKKRTAEIEAQVKAENDAILDEIDRNDFKWMASKGVEVLRGVSNFFYELAQAGPDQFGVRQEFADSTIGQLTRTAGSLPVTALFAYLGPVVGGAATYGSIYGEVEMERKAIEGDAYDPQRAFLANAASAGPQAIMEFAFGMERMMGNVLKATPKIGGRVAFGDALKVMGKRGLASGIEEGITEPTQNFWNDYVASLSYDDKRELLTPEAFKQRAIEGLTAFAFGSLFGAGVSGIDLVDRNRGVTKAERHLTTRNGQPFTPYDWAALRTAKTDEEIKGMAPDPGMSDVYLAAANGNPEAQAAYFKDAQERAFVETDGLSAHGMTIGKSGDAVAIRNADGSVITLDPANKEHSDFLLQLQADAVQAKNELEQREGATSETIKEFEKRFGDQVKIERMQLQTLSELTKSGVITADQESDALAAAIEINKALPTGSKDAYVMGLSSITRDEVTGAVRMAVKIAEGQSPEVVVEEVTESWKKKAIVEGNLDPAELTAQRQKWHAQEGEADPVADGKVSADRADTEWFSKRVIDYALANRKVELPGGWGKWLRTLGERLKAILRGAARMKKLLRDGKIDPQLEQWMQQALGAGKAEMSAEAFRKLTPTEQAAAAEAYLQKSPQGLEMLNEDLRAEMEAVAKAEQANAEAAPVVSELDAEMLAEAEKSAEFPAITGNEGDGFQVMDSAGKKIGSAQDLEAAKNIAIEWFYNQAIAEEKAQAMADLGTTKADELQRVIVRLGGLIAPSQGDMSGELRAIAENMTTAQKLRMFRKDALSLDAMAEALRGEGFKFETPNDVLVALEKSTRGEAVYPQRGEPGGLMSTFNLGNVENKPVALAKFLGIQEGMPKLGFPDIELWNLTEGIEGHGAGSTVSRQTIEKAGFYLPPAPKQDISFSLAQTETPEFKKWFGASKVVDAQGKPLVVYHTGTVKDVFTTRQGDFSNTQAQGAYFARSITDSEGIYKGETKEYYLSIQNPWVGDIAQYYQSKLDDALARFNEETQSEYSSWDNAKAELGGRFKSKVEAVFGDPTSSDSGPESRAIFILMEGWDIDPRLKTYDLENDGYDGQDDAWQIIAFEPTQIKSATRNRGTFDPTNADITFAITGIPQNNRHGGMPPGQIAADGDTSDMTFNMAPDSGAAQQKTSPIAERGSLRADRAVSGSVLFQSASGFPDDKVRIPTFSLIGQAVFSKKHAALIKKANEARGLIHDLGSAKHQLQIGVRRYFASSVDWINERIKERSNGAVDGYGMPYMEPSVLSELIAEVDKLAKEQIEKLTDIEADLFLLEEEDGGWAQRKVALQKADEWARKTRAAEFAALLDARDEEARIKSRTFVSRVWTAFAEHDEVFQYGRTESTDAEEIATAVSSPGRPVTVQATGESVEFSGKEGRLTIYDADTDRPYIRATDAKSQGKQGGGGSQLYAAALDWIHNNSKRIKDDTGLTEINAIRRTSNFLASAIRWGTTKHLKPHADQAVKWTKNESMNTSALAAKEMENAFNSIAEAKGWVYSFSDAQFRDSKGDTITRERFESAVRMGNPGKSGIGLSTLQRAVITHSAIEAFARGETETDVLGAPQRGVVPVGVTYSIAPQNKTQAMQAKLAQFRAQQAATFPYPYHQLATLPTQARISGKGHDGILLTAFEKNAAPMDERLRYISDRFGVNAPIMYRVRKYDMDKAQLLKKYSEMVAPLMRKLPQMTALDLENWTLAASNQDALMRDSLTAKYGMQNEWAQFTAARDQLRAEMLASGIEVGLIDEWFPRWVKDLVGLRESLGIEASDDPFEQAIIDAEKIKGRMLTNEEANDVLDAVVRGINFNGVSVSAPSNAKKRKIQTIGKAQFQFYADANSALSHWLEQSTERIARHRFFGKNIVALPSASIIAPTKIDLDASIGAIVREQLAAGNITATQQAELKSIIAGRFGFHGQTAGWLRDIMNVTYGAVLGQFHSALSNALDIVTTVVNYGPVDTAITMPKAIWNNAKNLPIIANSRTLSEAMEKRTKTKGWISRETLGVESVIEQFRDARFTAKAVQEVFKATNFTFMDGIGKEVMINTAFRSLAKKAKRGKLSTKQLATFNAMFGEQAARQVVADFAAGKQTPDTLFAVYNVLADWQPISLSQYPENYARHPNARFMWMLKIFAMKQLSAYKREGQLGAWFGDTKEAAGKAIKGDMKGAAKAFGRDFGTKAEGARKLTYLLALLVAAGASKDWIVDFYLDRDPQMEDEVLDNMFKIMAVSRYVVWNNRNRLHAEGAYGFVEGAAKLASNSKQILGDILTPPFWTLLERPAKDVAEFAKMQSEGADYDWAGSESVQFLPGIGAPIYWYSDKGKGKVERRRQLRERDRNPRRRRDRD